MQDIARNKTDTEIEAFYKCINGNVEAFRTIYSKYVLKVRSLLIRLAGFADIDDLTQIVFIKVWSNLKQLKNPEQLGTWIYKITINVAKDAWYQKQRYRKFNAELSDLSLIKDRVVSIDIEEYKNRIVLDEALNKLSFKYKQVIVMCDMENYKLSEVADILGVSEGTIKSRLFYARNKLKNILIKKGVRI